MFEEDHPLPGFKTPTECYTFWQLAFMALFSSWTLAGSAYWSPPYIIAGGIVGVTFFLMHGNSGQQTPSCSLRRYIALLAPFWIAVILAFIGLKYSPLHQSAVDYTDYYELTKPALFTPINTAPSSSWVPIMLKGAIMISVLNLLFIAESHYMLRRLIITLCANAIILALIGYIARILDASKILGITTSPNEFFFATFPHPNHWGAFALLWSVVLLGIIAHLRRRQSWMHIFAQKGVWLVAGAIILISTLFIIPSPIYSWLFCIGLCAAILHSCAHRFKYKGKSIGNRLLALVQGASGLAIGIGASYIYFNGLYEDYNSATFTETFLIKNKTIPLPLQLSLYKDSWEAFLAKPFFGWGSGSFYIVLNFYQNADISHYSFESAHSDLLESLVENGLFGTLIWFVVPFIYIIKFTRLKFKRMLSYYLFGACILGFIAGLIDFPFQNPAFAISYWIIFAGAYRWSETATFDTPVLETNTPHLIFTKQEMEKAIPDKLRRPQTKMPETKLRKRKSRRKSSKAE